MTIKLLLPSLILPAALLTSAAHATPTPYPTDLNWLHQVQNETTSGLIADDTDPHKVWVLPPNVAVGSAGHPHTPTANLGFCREMGDLQSYAKTTTNRISVLNDQRIPALEATEKTLAELGEARKAASAFAAEKKLQPLVDLDDRIHALEDRLTELYATAKDCKTTCGEIDTEIKGVEKEKRALGEDRRKLAQENAADVKAYDKKLALVNAIAQNYKDSSERYDQLIRDLRQIRDDYYAMYSTYGRMPGINVSFNYTSGWDANIGALRNANPSFQFEKIITQNAKLFASSVSVKDLPGDNAVIDYGLPGIKKDGYIELGSGFPEALTSNMILSLTGACPIQHPEYFDIEPGFGPDKMAYGLTITYDFPAAMKVEATASYNMYKMYQKIVSSGSSGGFFSSRSWTNVEEHNYFKDSFNIDWKTQDAGNSIPDDRRYEIEAEMRRHIMERIATLALPTSPDRQGILEANAPPAHGAVVVATSLVKTCPGSMYCVAGAAILTSLDAIFGSSQATASYLQTQDFTATEKWSNSEVVMKPWVTSYVSTQK